MTAPTFARRVSFREACASFVHRFTMDYTPGYKLAAYDHPELGAVYYAPLWASDQEWYNATKFPGDEGLHGNNGHCEPQSPETWPLGRGFLLTPYRKGEPAPVLLRPSRGGVPAHACFKLLDGMTDADFPATSLPLWSGKGEPPAIGAEVVCSDGAGTRVTVTGYTVEGRWLMVEGFRTADPAKRGNLAGVEILSGAA